MNEDYFESLSRTLLDCSFDEIRYCSGTSIPEEVFYEQLAMIEERMSLKFDHQLLPLYRLDHEDGHMNGGLIDAEYFECVVHSTPSSVITLNSVFELIPSETGTTELEHKIRKHTQVAAIKLIPFGNCTIYSKWEEPIAALICSDPGREIVISNNDEEKMASVASSFQELEKNLQMASFDHSF